MPTGLPRPEITQSGKELAWHRLGPARDGEGERLGVEGQEGVGAFGRPLHLGQQGLELAGDAVQHLVVGLMGHQGVAQPAQGGGQGQAGLGGEGRVDRGADLGVLIDGLSFCCGFHAHRCLPRPRNVAGTGWTTRTAILPPRDTVNGAASDDRWELRWDDCHDRASAPSQSSRRWRWAPWPSGWRRRHPPAPPAPRPPGRPPRYPADRTGPRRPLDSRHLRPVMPVGRVLRGGRLLPHRQWIDNNLSSVPRDLHGRGLAPGDRQPARQRRHRKDILRRALLGLVLERHLLRGRRPLPAQHRQRDRLRRDPVRLHLVAEHPALPAQCGTAANTGHRPQPDRLLRRRLLHRRRLLQVVGRRLPGHGRDPLGRDVDGGPAPQCARDGPECPRHNRLQRLHLHRATFSRPWARARAPQHRRSA